MCCKSVERSKMVQKHRLNFEENRNVFENRPGMIISFDTRQTKSDFYDEKENKKPDKEENTEPFSSLII